MAIAANLGFPRIGSRRELKRAIENYWQGTCRAEELWATARALRRRHWELQRDAGIRHIPSGDFSLYDHVLDTAAMVGAIPDRFHAPQGPLDLETYFALARGSRRVPPLEMTKWFDTNYHYLVPEFEPGQSFRLASTGPIDAFREALDLGIHTRPVLLGPVSFLLLGKSRSPGADPLALLDGLTAVYEELLAGLAAAGADWVQIDEPVLALDLPAEAAPAMDSAYRRLAAVSPQIKLCLATYFGALGDNLPAALRLPVAAVHLDLVRAPEQLTPALDLLPAGRMLSLGVVDGRNVWRCDLSRAAGQLRAAAGRIGPERILVGPSCSLLHCPIDLELEKDLDADLRGWMAFARQKLDEIVLLARAVDEGPSAVADGLAAGDRARQDRSQSPLVHHADVKSRLAAVAPAMLRRSRPFAQRRAQQQQTLGLPLLPTTTIGSFPQTAEVRKARAARKRGDWSPERYDEFCRCRIDEAVSFQEDIGLDVLVHGEFERNDMVEYFGEQLEGFAFTANGWVQSYGTRCVKPPVIYGDVSRPRPMTVAWSRYAQSLTSRPMKGMLTGPVTILEWSFVRDDQPRRDTAFQIALAIRDEVADLEAAGIRVIQIDEPALREGLPLARCERAAYLRWAVDAFRLAACGVSDGTQIHTHMCYGEFGDVLEAIVELDADVISIEASRSDMELLEAFRQFRYPHDIGPGVYDIHSPRVPEVGEIAGRLRKALVRLRPEQLWVNPDCGLKTRGWPEVRAALANMVAAARRVREELSVS
ncbi:MAG: 5-methyltetrahydropteroyltriglutamate--homocysteine S-methyltransferase [Thermoguttaceae bacterium]|jgi:5-methyltetrahydropteroyltriglutamate--homocysteine methyltransferase